MSNRKKLWSIFGPLIVAILMVMVVFLLPWKFNNTPAIEQKAADSLSATVFKNRNLKVAALSDKKANYVGNGRSLSRLQAVFVWFPGNAIIAPTL